MMSIGILINAIQIAAQTEVLQYTPVMINSRRERMPTPGKRRKHRNRKKR
jgi:hypothetical protein